MRLLRWLVAREREEQATPLNGRDLLSRGAQLCGDDPSPWASVARAVGELRGLGCLEWRYLFYPGETHEPAPHLLTERTVQQIEDVMVAPTGYRLFADLERKDETTSITIGQVSVGQFALGNIQNVDFFVILQAAEQQLEQMDFDEDAKNEARGILRKIRETGGSVTSSAAGSVLAAALRQVLGLP
jgi:hypothetical protein